MRIIDLILRRKDDLTPPKKMVHTIGGGNFKKVGEDFLKYFKDLGELKSNEIVLDVGCGVGRMAVPLTKYLDNSGSYEGFDIVADGIDWCKNKISPRHPNFNFQLADVYNKNYHPYGKFVASEYKFPYKNEYFDFVFLTSVFTHMLPPDMENYFCEIARVLKKNGRCLISFFLFNNEALQLIKAGKSTLDFKYDLETHYTTDISTPEAAIAFKEEFILSLYEKYRLKLSEPIKNGSWCGRKKFLSFQDIIIATKK